MERCKTLDKLAKNSFLLEITYVISNDDLIETLENARQNIKDWEKPSKANKGLSIGVHWNLFCKDFYISNDISKICKYRILEQHQKFLPNHLQEPKAKLVRNKPSHQEPIFQQTPSASN